MSRNSLINEAIAEAKAVREAALENAKSMIVEAFTPSLKTKINKELEADSLNENDQPSGYDSEGGQKRIPGGEDPSSKGDGPAIYEDDETVESDEQTEDVFEIALSEDEDSENDEEEEEEEEEGDDDAEEIAYENAYAVSEDVKAYVAGLQNENAAYKKAVKQLQKEFSEVNLFNAKLIYANKVLRTPGLTKNQKYSIVERFDDAGSIQEVKIIFNSLTEGVKIGTSVNRKPKAHKSSAPVKSVSSNGSVINEEFERLQELSGLLKD